MMTIDGTDEKVYKVTHALGFKSLTYPKGLVLKMNEYGSLDAELMPYDSYANPLFGGTVCYFNKKENPKPWSGPEDGLPPIGIECDFSNNRVKIIAHIDQPACLDDEYKKLAVGQQGDRGPIVFGRARNFSLAKTQEQLDADQRETAIREIMDVADVDCRVTAARLVDAGFKREVV